MDLALHTRRARFPERFGATPTSETDPHLAAEAAEDEEISARGRLNAARGAIVGILLGSAIWVTIITLIVRR